MTHYQAARPLRTHWRKASCSEVRCPQYLQGWMTVVPSDSPQAYYIRHEDRTRRFVEQRGEGGMSAFTFEAGQECFREHSKQLERSPLLFKGDRALDTHELAIGDLRGSREQEVNRWLNDFREDTEVPNLTEV